MMFKERKFSQALEKAKKAIAANNRKAASYHYLKAKRLYEAVAQKIGLEKASLFHKELLEIHGQLSRLNRPKKEPEKLIEKKAEKKEEREEEERVSSKPSEPAKKYSLKDFLLRLMPKKVKKKPRKKLEFYMGRAGITVKSSFVYRRIFHIAILFDLVLSAFLLSYFSFSAGFTPAYAALVLFLLWLPFFYLLLISLLLLFHLYIDVRIFRRKAALEDVLPDFLQLTAANVRAGMAMDKALWYAIRPRFGILANEIERVAKDTMGGKDLRDALKDFSQYYDSETLKRAISLIVEGLNAGGEMGALLNRIALDIQESRIIRKEMAANVTTYVIFISFATIVAAPFLFALSHQLIVIIGKLTSTIGTPTLAVGLPLSFKGTSISSADFKIFAAVSLMVTSFFSSIIIATIKKGNVKAALSYIPIFMISTLVLFFISNAIVERILGVFF